MTTTHPREPRLPEETGEPSRLPRLSRYTIERPVLFERLDRALREQVTIVRAPAGYGKTSLVRKWLEQGEGANRPSPIWIDLDLIGGGTDGFWDVARRTLDPRNESVPSGDDPLTAVQESIGRRMDTVVMVLDGYTRRWDGRLSGELAQLLRRTPNLHLMVLTRALTSFEAPALAAVLDLVVVQNDDLAFERHELDEVVRVLGIDVESRVLDHVWTRSHGWPLAVRAMVRIFDDPRAVLPEPVVARALNEISETVVSELLAHAPVPSGERDGLDGLQRAAVAPYLEQHIAARLEADGVDAGVLELAEAAGLGVWNYARGHGRLVYQLLEPVRAVLRSQLDEKSPGEGERLAGELLEVLEANGDPITALRQALHSSEIVAAETILARNWSSAFTPDAADYLDELGVIDLAVLRSSPILLTVTGLLREYSGGDSRAALEYYQAAAEPQVPRNRRLDPVRQYWTELTAMIALRKVGRLSEAEELLSAVSSPDPSVTEPPVAWLEIGLTQLRLARDEEAAAAFERSAIGAADDADLRAYATGAAALAYALHGEIDRAQTVAARIESSEHGRPTRGASALVPVMVASQLIRTETDLDDGDRVESLSHLGAGLGELHSYAAYAAALRSLAEGRVEHAQQIIDAELLSKSPYKPSNTEQARFVALEGDLLMSQGNLVAAQKVIRAFPDGTNALRPVSARLLLMFREYRSAQLLAEAVLGEGGGPRIRVEMLLVQAEALHRLKSARGATIRLNAHRVAEVNGLRTPFALTIAKRDAPSGDGDDSRSADTPFGRVKPLFSEAAMAAQLTQRERIVLDRLQSTASLEYIARSLVVSINTVKTQTRSIYRKLGANSRDEAVRIAYDLGLLRPRLPLGRNRYEGDDRIA
jgi:LuxR family maltose regulon positive regulatory protein